MERAKRQLDIQDAAKLIGLSRYSLSWIEKGRRHPKDTTLARIAEVYELDLEELMAIAEAPPKEEFRMPLELEAAEEAFSEFAQQLEGLSFDELNELGRRLMDEHREALAPRKKSSGFGDAYIPKDIGKAATLYGQRILVSAALQREAERLRVDVDPELVVAPA